MSSLKRVRGPFNADLDLILGEGFDLGFTLNEGFGGLTPYSSAGVTLELGRGEAVVACVFTPDEVLAYTKYTVSPPIRS